MEQGSDQSRQFLERSIAEVLRFVQLVWTWSSEQIFKVTQAQWENWPLWKQLLLLVVAALVVYFLFIAAKQLWVAAINVLAAIATLIGTVIVTLPTILIAGLVALAGLWVINNFHDLSSLRSLIMFHDQSSGNAQ
ncbi:MAG TPA: hypothetical protein VKC66_02445 [Xanthobacteraceae bacterium]|nr:hypothetical protein [Xanthobacteraceae bacterium]